MSDFIPPKLNKAVIAGTKALLPLCLRIDHLDVRASANCITTIRRLRNTHTVIMANHSDRSDPTTLFTLAKQANEDFYYLAARELFDHEFGLRGLWLQNVGVYSVVRGDPPDLASKEKTISLIVEGEKKLVMFPEGDVSGRDDVILPLKDDGIQNLFEAQLRLAEKSDDEPVMLLPVAAFYQVTDGTMQHLDRCLSRLEQLLGLPTQPGSLSSRIERVATEMIDHLERFYGLPAAQDQTSPARLRRVCRHVALLVAQSFDIDAPTDKGEAVLLYSVRGRLRPPPEDPHAIRCGYWQRLHKLSDRRKKEAARDLDVMQQLLILASTFEQPISPESAWRLVDRLEYLLTERLTPKGIRIVWLESGQPIDLREFLADYAKEANVTRGRIDHLVRSRLGEVLQQLKSSCGRHAHQSLI